MYPILVGKVQHSMGKLIKWIREWLRKDDTVKDYCLMNEKWCRSHLELVRYVERDMYH